MTNSSFPDPFGLFLKPAFLDEETCARIRAEARSVPGHPAPVYLDDSPDLIHQNVRKTTSIEISEATIAMVHQRLRELTSELSEHFGLELEDCESPQFLMYKPGDFFVRHQDGNTGLIKFDHLRVRRVSIVVFLNQEVTDESVPESYGGGALMFYGNTPPPEFAPLEQKLHGETGLLVAFAAQTTHEVPPIAFGERFSIVTWFK